MLDLNKVFLFSDSDKRNSFRAQILNKDIEEDYLFSSESKDDEIMFNWLQGSQFYDIVPTGYPGIYLVSEKVQIILKEAKFKGFSLRPITLKNRKNENVNGYQLLSIVSKVGSIINEKSIKKIMPPIVSWGDPYEANVGLYFDVSTWNGSHFFYPDGTFYMFVLEEVKDLFEKHKVSNCQFDKVTEVVNHGIR
ncbi:imm11 family protein [Belliella aquatica]|uniref:Immunity MXAN-0049 protein domain-containing protein n=1 Tax=Belliella aquatica TaxID=1323734 RepID=A0ABQ1MQ57_9BACT|nr:DUF1629 domain-containing protein [Belliella aquatica]MCH7406211.1 hypothetical protein [Belliella aquatica]GGC44368.1 hypothetical protein GCM10010993_23590 [Belliella aquatica]